MREISASKRFDQRYHLYFATVAQTGLFHCGSRCLKSGNCEMNHKCTIYHEHHGATRASKPYSLPVCL